MTAVPICSICCENFSSDCVVKVTKCGHLFHDVCIQGWLSRKPSCPECRQSQLPTLKRVYLNFIDNSALQTPVPGETDQIENLIKQLSLEEEKHKMTEILLKKNERKLHKESKDFREKLSTQSHLLKEYKEKLSEMKKLLEQSQTNLKQSEAVATNYKRELYLYRQQSRRQPTELINNERETKTKNVTIKVKTRCSVHGVVVRTQKVIERDMTIINN